jgi:uncharacterized protein
MNIPESKIREVLSANKKIAVYGLSPDPSKPSHDVPLFMRSKGYDLVGLYPKEHSVNGFKIYTQLADIPLEYRKFVNVFRASAKIPEVVDEVLKAGGTEVLWLQLGIANPAAEKRAEEAGLTVISNRCLYIEYMKWLA